MMKLTFYPSKINYLKNSVFLVLMFKLYFDQPMLTSKHDFYFKQFFFAYMKLKTSILNIICQHNINFDFIIELQTINLFMFLKTLLCFVDCICEFIIKFDMYIINLASHDSIIKIV